MASTKINPTATITNNLEYGVDIYDVFKPDADTDANGPLKYQKLATISKGASAQVQTIHFASQLQAMRTDNIKALNDNYFLQFPVGVMAVSGFDIAPAFTLTGDMQEGMEQSFKFIKYAQANPTSQLAKNFRIALGDKKSQKDAVDAFFLGTPSFKKCTLITWIAVFSWQAQFTNPWQGTYYLYSLGSSTAGNTAAPALMATLVITASAQTDSAVLKMAGTNDQSTTVVMAGDGTMREEIQGDGGLAVNLTPTWLNVTQTSQKDGKPLANFAIGAAFIGNINGQKVTGNLNQLAVPKPSDTSTNAKDKSAANSLSLNTLAQLIGIVTSIAMVYYMAKGHKATETQKKNEVQEKATDELDANARESEIELNYQDNEVSMQRMDLEHVESTFVPEVPAAAREVRQARWAQLNQMSIERQIRRLRARLEAGAPSPVTEATAESLANARADIERAIDPATSVAEREAAINEASTTLADTSTALQTALEDVSNDLSQQEQETLQDVEEALNEAGAQADAARENELEHERELENDHETEVNEDNFEEPEAEEPAEYVEPMEPIL